MSRPYRPADPDNHAVESARAAFLNLYRLHRPELMLKLRDRALPVFSHQVPAELHMVLDLSDWYVIQVECPELGKVLTSWAEEFGLTFQQKPADWALLFALATLERWQRSRKALENLKWGQPAGLHEEFPFGGDPGFFSLTGEPDGEIFLTPPQTPIWNWAAGESEREFRQRHRLHYAKAAEQYTALVTEEKRRRGWSRAPLAGGEYLEALAMHKVGKRLVSIQRLMQRRGMSVGCEGDLSAVAHGIERAANSIYIDAPATMRCNLK